MPPDLPSVTRRTTVGAALLGLVTVSGCDLDDLDPRSEPAAPGAPATSAAPQDADTTLVAGVVADLTTALAATRSVARPDRAAFRPLTRLHRRHLAELDAVADAPSPGVAVAAAEAVRQEQRLQRRLATAAVAAESGELAVVLASMSAAVAQRLATLPGTVGR